MDFLRRRRSSRKKDTWLTWPPAAACTKVALFLQPSVLAIPCEASCFPLLASRNIFSGTHSLPLFASALSCKKKRFHQFYVSLFSSRKMLLLKKIVSPTWLFCSGTRLQPDEALDSDPWPSPVFASA